MVSALLAQAGGQHLALLKFFEEFYESNLSFLD